MRPIELRMTAFGPYKDEEVIKFTDLKEHSLFVIAGNTGAGKTTIFDAICFALYGSASGQDRDHHSMLRSHFAGDDDHTSVQLIFEIHGRTFRLLRRLGHIKPGNKTATGERYEFFEKIGEDEKPVVERQIVSVINEKVEDLLGLTENQFKQIVMLPQGEFLKLLTSETENKEEILRRIFKTEHYQQLNTLLRQRKNEIEDQYKQEKIAIDQQIEHMRATLPERESSQLFITLGSEHYNNEQVTIGLAEEKDYYLAKAAKDQKIYEQTNKDYEKEQQLFYAAEQLNKKFADLAEKKKILGELTERKSFIKAQEEKLLAAEKAEKIKPYETQHKQSVAAQKNEAKNVQQLTIQVKNAQEKFATAEKQFAEAKEQEPLRKELQQALGRLKDHLPFVEQLDEQQKVVNDLQKGVKNYESKIDALKKEHTDKIDQKNELSKKIQQIEKSLDELTPQQQRLSLVKEKLLAIENYQTAQKTLQETKEKQRTAKLIYENLQSKYNELEQSWLNDQAHVLSTHLQDGQPCPVCGSEHHPNPAMTKDGSVTQAELTALRNEFNEAQAHYTQANAYLETHQDQREKSVQVIERFEINLEQLTVTNTQLQNEKADLTTAISELLEQQKQLRDLREQSQNLDKEIATKQTELEETQTKHTNTQIKLKEKESILQNELERVPENVRELSILTKQISEKEKELKTLAESYTRTEQAFQTAKDLVNKLTTQLEMSKKHLITVTEQAEKAKNVFLQALKDSEFTSPEQFYSALLPKDEQLQIKEQVATYKQQFQLVTEQVKGLEKELKDQQKVDLQALKERVDQLQKIAQNHYKTWQQSQTLHKEADRLKERFEQTVAQAKQQEAQLNRMADLYDVARGQNERRLSFERFLQIEYLEQIIQAANLRLQRLSNGQFWLQRSERQESHGRQSGLGFDVFDEYTGKLRDVKTLSGGEKFNASLCLALGMSDVVQSFQGNISIDTMFIDEGFGALDQETLNKAIETLVDLQTSGRMIGVISHVQELKNVFPAVLEVTKTKDGYSQTKFIIN